MHFRIESVTLKGVSCSSKGSEIRLLVVRTGPYATAVVRHIAQVSTAVKCLVDTQIGVQVPAQIFNPVWMLLQ